MKSDQFIAFMAVCVCVIFLLVLVSYKTWFSPKTDVSSTNVISDITSSSSSTSMKTYKAPEMIIDTNKKYRATLETSLGNIDIELNATATPKTVNNFVSLAQNGFYNNTVFHRVIKGFMIQGGDPIGNGTGGPGYKFDDEAFTGEYTRGTIAMANSGPNTNGSQFFIMHKDYPLPKNYVIFGKVTKGIEVVDQITEGQVKANESGELSVPVSPVIVKKVTITTK